MSTLPFWNSHFLPILDFLICFPFWTQSVVYQVWLHAWGTWSLLLRVHWSTTIPFPERAFRTSLFMFLVKPLCPVSAIFHAFSLTWSVVPASQALCFQICSLKVSCFTYKIFMDLLKEALLSIGLSPKDYGTSRGTLFFPRDWHTFWCNRNCGRLKVWCCVFMHVPVSQQVYAQENSVIFIIIYH